MRGRLIACTGCSDCWMERRKIGPYSCTGCGTSGQVLPRIWICGACWADQHVGQTCPGTRCFDAIQAARDEREQQGSGDRAQPLPKFAPSPRPHRPQGPVASPPPTPWPRQCQPAQPAQQSLYEEASACAAVHASAPPGPAAAYVATTVPAAVGASSAACAATTAPAAVHAAALSTPAQAPPAQGSSTPPPDTMATLSPTLAAIQTTLGRLESQMTTVADMDRRLRRIEVIARQWTHQDDAEWQC